MPTEYLQCGMSIWTQKQKIVISGKTYEHRDILKKLGGQWNPEKRHWIFKLDTEFDELYALKPFWCCCQKAVVKNKKNRMYSCEIHHPDGTKPDWFCGHDGADVISHSGHMSWCRTCSPCPHTGGFLVNGFTKTTD